MKLKHLPDIYRTFGARDLSRRLMYELDRRSGQLKRRTPVSTWETQPPYEGRLGYFFFKPAQHQNYQALIQRLGLDSSDICTRADRILEGELLYFSSTQYQLEFPPDWHYHPKTKQHFPTTNHWTEIPDLSPELGDIKMVWEMSRFSFVFSLVRAYYVDFDARYAEAFWQSIESWLVANPPNQGANWKCGQETALRLIAWTFGLFAFADANATTPLRRKTILKAMASQAERIEKNIRYALSQRNNHGISEALGLWTIGLILPEHPRAAIWQNKGKHLLESLAAEQIYLDGAYIQHSFNYQRLMLSLYLWALRLGEVNGRPLSKGLYEAVLRSALLLYQLQDVSTGQLPNYGSNDGALLFPLSSNDYEDYRPIIQAIHVLTKQERIYPKANHDELLWWFWDKCILESPLHSEKQHDLKAKDGGYFTLRGDQSFVFIRAATYRHRPHQADNLHLDLWHKGTNIVFDPGTYAYNAPQPWRNGLVHTPVHNTVTVDGQDQMQRGSRFLWFGWLRSELIQETQQGDIRWLEFKHSAYQNLSIPVFHQRSVIAIHDSYICIDRLRSKELHDYQLQWNLWRKPDTWEQGSQSAFYSHPWPYHLQVLSNKPLQSKLHETAKDKTRAWRSTRYGQKQSASSLTISSRQASCLFITLFGHQNATWNDHQCHVNLAQGKLTIELNIEADRIINAVQWRPTTSY